MMNFIVNQDRNKVYTCTEQSYFNIKEVTLNNVLIGESLYMDRKYLGTFESYEDACEELRTIVNGKEELYGISGYSEEEFAPDID